MSEGSGRKAAAGLAVAVKYTAAQHYPLTGSCYKCLNKQRQACGDPQRVDVARAPSQEDALSIRSRLKDSKVLVLEARKKGGMLDKIHNYEGSDDHFAYVGRKEIIEVENHAFKKGNNSILTFCSSLP